MPANEAGAAPGVETDFGVVLKSWWRIGVAAVVAGQSMVLSLGVNATRPEGTAYWLVHGGLITAALIVCALLLPALVREAFGALRERRVGVEFLFLLTLAGAFAASLTATFTRVGDVYYEVISILLAVYTAGKTLGARSRAKALRAVGETRERYDQVERLDGTRESVERIAVGELVRIRPGSAIAVDGIVRQGASFVRETALTGEWRPVSRGIGEPVLAGTHALDGELVVEVTAPAGQRRLDAILAAVAEAQLAPSRLQRTGDRLAAWFLPIVLLVSAGTFGFWMWRSDWVHALFNAMAVLLVACPCALGLVTPLAVFRGLSRLAELGLVARTGDVLDGLARGDHVCFDKTGTLSEDRLVVRAWRFAPEFVTREAWIRAAVAASERGLAHPIARALSEEMSPAPQTSVAVSGLRILPGQGIEARVEGRRLRIGRASVANAQESSTTSARDVTVEIDGAVAATIEFEESWRPGSREVFDELRALGITSEILTGDASSTPSDFGAVTIARGLLPEQKRERVAKLEREGRRVIFVGDGINDASAMAGATLSIAMGGGASLARAASPAVFLGSDLRFLPAAIRLARDLQHVVTTNLRFAAAYNAVGMVLAAAGWLHPVVAALLMLGSSAFVSIRTLRR